MEGDNRLLQWAGFLLLLLTATLLIFNDVLDVNIATLIKVVMFFTGLVFWLQAFHRLPGLWRNNNNNE